MTESITNALTSCRAAWAAFFAENGLSSDAITFLDGTPIYAWCLHHEILSEKLFEPIENRISYILTHKLKGEQECRFLNLRPVSREHCTTVNTARAKYLKAQATARKAQATARKAQATAYAEYENAIAPARAEYQKATALAWDEYKKAQATARAEYQKPIAIAWDEYKKATAAAWADYKKATDTPLGRVPEGQGRRLCRVPGLSRSSSPHRCPPPHLERHFDFFRLNRAYGGRAP